MADRKKFNFSVTSKKFLTFNSRDIKTDLMRWDIFNRISLSTFTYNEYFKDYEAKDFVTDFFANPEVQSHLKVYSSNSQQLVTWGSHQIKECQVDNVPCSITSMDFFDRLKTDGLVRKSGAIYKCIDEDVQGFLISDELHRMLLTDESEHWDLYSEEERSELLFQLFKHLVLGGPVCQYDDNIDRYLDVTKSLYKELITVQKNSETKAIEIVSKVFRVSAWDDEICWFPGDSHVQTFCYLIINPVNRVVTAFSHDFGKGIW